MKLSKRFFSLLSLMAAALFVTSAAHANSIPNSNFTIAGAVPIGTQFTTTSSTNSSAAADWGMFMPDPNSSATTQLLASSDVLSGDVGNMLLFFTNSGFDGSAGNGVFTAGLFNLPAGTTGFMDIYGALGTSGEIGFVCGGGAFCNGSDLFAGTGSWQRISFSTNGPTDEFGFEIFSAGGGEMLVADPTAPTPEPDTLLLLGSGLLGFVPLIRRKFARG